MERENRPLVIDLAQARLPEPAVGEEVAGTPVELAWPTQKVAIDYGLAGEERDQLTAAGWTICATDTAEIRAALQNGEA